MINDTSNWRGHPIIWSEKRQAWLYKDTNDLVSLLPMRSCGKCKIPQRNDTDPCLGKLPGVINACCGHGKPKESYIQFENGVIVRGFTQIELPEVDIISRKYKQHEDSTQMNRV